MTGEEGPRLELPADADVAETVTFVAKLRATAEYERSNGGIDPVEPSDVEGTDYWALLTKIAGDRRGEGIDADPSTVLAQVAGYTDEDGSGEATTEAVGRLAAHANALYAATADDFAEGAADAWTVSEQARLNAKHAAIRGTGLTDPFREVDAMSRERLDRGPEPREALDDADGRLGDLVDRYERTVDRAAEAERDRDGRDG